MSDPRCLGVGELKIRQVADDECIPSFPGDERDGVPRDKAKFRLVEYGCSGIEHELDSRPIDIIDWSEREAPKPELFLHVARSDRGQFAAWVVRQCYVVHDAETADRLCECGYDTSDVVAIVANPEALEGSELAATMLRVSRAERALIAADLTDYAIDHMRRHLFEVANDKIVAARASISSDVPAEAVAEWEKDTGRLFLWNLSCDFQNFGVRADMVWEKRRFFFELCGVSPEEVRAFLGRDIGNWWPEPPSLDDLNQFIGLGSGYGVDPIVQKTFEDLWSKPDAGLEPPA